MYLQASFLGVKLVLHGEETIDEGKNNVTATK